MKPKPNTGPVTLVMPNTIESKMEAITLVAKAVYQLSLALNSAHVDAHISNCIIENAKENGIKIG